MSKIPSYGKVWALGQPPTHSIVGRFVDIQEKTDGSQCSFMFDGETLYARSKGAELIEGAIPELFRPTYAHFAHLASAGALPPGRIYRGEAFKSARHNVLTYGRVPMGHFVLFDVDTNGMQSYADHETIAAEAHRLGVEPVPLLFRGVLVSSDQVTDLLRTESCLGGALVEGVVVKPHDPDYYSDGKRIVAKIVSEAFKETHRKEWVPDRPQREDVITRVVAAVSTPARWDKAIQRLRESGNCTDSPKDIGALIGSIQADIREECEHDIKEMLFDAFRKDIMRLTTSQFPQWYKERLARSAFQTQSDASEE